MDRSETDRRRREDLADLLDELRGHGGPVIVEGPRDRDALISGGIPTGRVIMLHGKANLDIVDELEGARDEVILLLDFDAEGEKIHARLKRELQRLGIKVSTRYRDKIRAIFDGHIDCIEHLKRYMEGGAD